MSWVGSTVFGVGYVGDKLQSLFLLAVRLYWGWLFCVTGYGKFTNIDSVISFFSQLGLPMPGFMAYLIAFIELVGGACLFFGIASRFVGFILMLLMLGAYITAHQEVFMSFFSKPELFVTTGAFSYLLAGMINFFCGPGRWSLDRFVFHRDEPT